jgi:hypothetical protein
MCHDCWVNEYGRPTTVPENVDEIVSAIEAVYAHQDGGTGGPLHVQLDDFNIEGDWVPWRAEEDDRPYPDDLYDLCLEVQRLVKPLPLDQRAAVLARWEGWH